MGYMSSNTPVAYETWPTTHLYAKIGLFSIPFLKSRLNASEKGIVISMDGRPELPHRIGEALLCDDQFFFVAKRRIGKR